MWQPLLQQLDSPQAALQTTTLKPSELAAPGQLSRTDLLLAHDLSLLEGIAQPLASLPRKTQLSVRPELRDPSGKWLAFGTRLIAVAGRAKTLPKVDSLPLSELIDRASKQDERLGWAPSEPWVKTWCAALIHRWGYPAAERFFRRWRDINARTYASTTAARGDLLAREIDWLIAPAPIPTQYDLPAVPHRYLSVDDIEANNDTDGQRLVPIPAVLTLLHHPQRGDHARAALDLLLGPTAASAMKQAGNFIPVSLAAITPRAAATVETLALLPLPPLNAAAWTKAAVLLRELGWGH